MTATILYSTHVSTDQDPTIRERILNELTTKGRDFQYLYAKCLPADNRSESYLRNVLAEMKKEGLIGRTMKTYWLMTEERKKNYTRVGQVQAQQPGARQTITDLWCRAIVAPDNEDRIQRLKNQFTKEDGQAFLVAGLLLMGETLPPINPLRPEDWNDEVHDRWFQVCKWLNLYD